MDDSKCVESISPSPSPISNLDTDLIWVILSKNANMYNPIEYEPEWNQELIKPSALNTTLVASQVCRSWRNLLLDSPFIWGRLLRLDCLHQLGNKGREEIMRRTADAPLCLMGNIPNSKPAIDFFCSLLRSNWSRIQKIHVRVQNILVFEQSVWDVFLLAAPSLEWFHIKSAYHGLQPFTKNDHVALFSNNAPRLRVLHPDMIGFSLDGAHWMVQLRSLKLETNTIEAIRVLDAIKQMPCLEYLDLNYLSGRLNPHLVKPESIYLPHLMNLRLFTSFHTSLTFARSIKPAKHCVLAYYTRLPFEERATTEDVAATMEVLDRYSEMYFPFWNVWKLALVLNTMHFHLETLWGGYQPRVDFPGRLYGFAASLSAVMGWPQGVDSTSFLALFQRYNLSNVKMFNFELSQLKLLDAPTAWLNIAKFIHPLSAVESLQITEFTLKVLTEHETDEHLYFSRLRILRLLSPSLDNEGISTFWKFYKRRKNHGVPIKVVDLTEDPIGDWSFLEEADGLQVTWEMDEIPSEYICGSGEAGKLDFSSISDEE